MGPSEARTTAWNTLKHDAGSPTLTHLKALVDHHQWLSAHQPLDHALNGLPAAKLEQFAAEARSLDAARMQVLEPHRRYTLAAVLLQTQLSRALDDLGQMFIKRMMRIHRRGKEALALYYLKHQERTDNLIRTLREVVTAYHTEGDAPQRLAAIGRSSLTTVRSYWNNATRTRPMPATTTLPFSGGSTRATGRR